MTTTDGSQTYYQDKADVLDAIVIGAGWAGIGAAKTLQANDLDFVVLEARDYIGGRSHSQRLDASSIVDLGSNWIVGTDATKNPLYKLTLDLHVPTIVSRLETSYAIYSNEYKSSTPHRIPQAAFEQLEKDLFRKGFLPFMAKRQESTEVDTSLRRTANLYKESQNLTKEETLALEFLMDSYISQEYAASLETMSTWWWDSDYDIPGKSVILPNGFQDLATKSAREFEDKIHLKTKVVKIDWSNDCVKVVYVNEKNVTKTVQAHSVVVTVPLGVLQRRSIGFKPALPKWKQASIQRLGMGLLNKAFFKWNDSVSLPWPSTKEWLEKIGTPQGRWTEFFNLQPLTGQKILLAFSAGAEAERVEQLTDTEIEEEALASLKEMFKQNVPAPSHTLVTRWNQDEFSYGSYSYYKLGTRGPRYKLGTRGPRDRKNLQASLNDRIYFAGEACHLRYPSTTHGAYMSGTDTGGEVVAERRRKQRVLQRM